jgi:hypothetical protein
MPRLKNDYNKTPSLLPGAAFLAATRPPWGTTFVLTLFVFTPEVPLRAYQLMFYYAPTWTKIQAYASISPKNVIK